ncbi:MAG: hypothetical protein KGY75_08080 [Candidatus Cloacimonetes bacterium]|nr:hypothetical protein [Candidatus Cloacimonadota bacterium]MBS3768059.1 hypothetical protein [Candidatus Cloacimonadota bacterium]
MITIFNFNEAIKYENVRLGCPFFFAYVFSLGKQRKNEDRSIYTPHHFVVPPSQEGNLYHPIFLFIASSE